MALPVEHQIRYWGLAAVVTFVLLWALGDVILPFVLGGAIAYCLDPIADALERLGLSRALSTTLITLAAVLLFVVLALAVLPALVEQAIALVNVAPQLVRDLQAFLTERFPSLVDEGSAMRRSLVSLGELIQSKGGTLVEGLLTSALSLLNILVLVFIVPVVAFYLLLDWDRMVARVDELLPRDHAPVIRRLAGEIDATLANFIRGQGMVMTILGVYYAAALMIAGLQFGLIVGAIAGVVSFIPYVGAIVGGGLAIGLALFQFWGDWIMIAVIAAIFFAGQMLEGNVLTPKLVGGSVGLHPVWLLLALSVFGSLFGFVGMLVAVPVSAALGVLARFAVEQYKEGRLYIGLTDRAQTGTGTRADPVAEQLTFDLPVRTALARGDFFVSPANAQAVAAIDGWRDWPLGKLVLTGPPGSGKSHLVQVWAAMTGARVLAAADVAAADLPGAAAGPLAVEGAEALAGDAAAERALFHLHNLAREAQNPLLLTARQPPARWPIALPDLASRLQACAIAQLHPPDDALLSAVLVKLFADRQLGVPPVVIGYLAGQMERSFAAAAQIVDALDRAALTQRHAITRPFAAAVLDKLAQGGA